MKTGLLKFLCVGVSVFALNGRVAAQDQNLIIMPDTKEVYIPREPTEEERAHYALVAEAEQKWEALYSNPQDARLHWDVAKHYILLGSGDIALHELGRAEALGITRAVLATDIGKAYLLRGRYHDVLNEVILEDVPAQDHGEAYLVLGHAHYALNNMKDAFIHYYQADEFIKGDRLELTKPLATLYSMSGDYEKAEQIVDKAMLKSRKDADLFMLKGDLVHRRKGVESSYKYYEMANFYRPDDVETAVKLAGALYDLKRKDEAMEMLRQIVSKDEKHAYGNYMIAVLFAEGNNIRTATRYLNVAGNAYDDFIPGLMLKAKLAYATNDYGLAERPLERVIRLKPEHVEARRILGAVLMRQQKYAEAVRVLEYLEENNMLEGRDVLLLGSAYLLAGEDDRGSGYLERASMVGLDQISELERRKLRAFNRGENFGVSINLDEIIEKNSSINQRLIVQTYEALLESQYKKVRENAAKLIDQQRTNPIGYNLLGLAYSGQNKSAEARSNFSRAIEIDREYHQARLNLAKLEMKFGNRNAAINQLNQILSRDESYIPAYDMLFDLARADDDLIRAERYLTTAISAKPRLMSIREKLMDFYFAENKLAKAKNLAQRMVQTFPDHAASYKALGRVNMQMGEIIVARDNFERSLELDNRNADVYIMLSKVYMENNENEKSRPLLQSGLIHVKDILSLQKELIALAPYDNDFVNSYHFIDQLKLDEKTKADAFLYQGELNLLEQRGSDALLSFESAAKAGAGEDLVVAGLERATLMVENTTLIQAIEVPMDVPVELPVDDPLEDPIE